jgi:hypothetical protein
VRDNIRVPLIAWYKEQWRLFNVARRRHDDEIAELAENTSSSEISCVIPVHLPNFAMHRKFENSFCPWASTIGSSSESSRRKGDALLPIMAIIGDGRIAARLRLDRLILIPRSRYLHALMEGSDVYHRQTVAPAWK